MNKSISVELLEKYVNGKCTSEEKEQVKKWYFSFENEPDHISELHKSQEVQLQEQIYNRILNNIGIVEECTSEQLISAKEGKTNYLFKFWYGFAGVAAVLLVCFGVFLNNKPTAAKLQVINTGVSHMVLLANNTKQIFKATLPDSSIVWLSPSAKIYFPKVFNTNFRAITMSGECFFEVTKNSTRPFIITSKSIITKVWGTSFRIRDGLKSNMTDVAVLTGKVSVSVKNNALKAADFKLNKNEVMLYPHQKVVYLANEHILRAGTIEKSALERWNRINLSFENIKLKDIVPILNAKYNVHIIVDNEKLNNYMISADFTEFNLPDVLQALKKILGINYEVTDNNIELNKSIN